MDPQFNPKPKQIKLIIIIFGFLFLTIVIFSVVTMIYRSDKIKVSINFEPTETKVFLNNSNKNINNSTLYLPEGNYNITAFLDGYIYQNQTININEYNTQFVGQLIPTNASEDEILRLFEENDQRDKIAQMEDNNRLIEKYPLIAYLPYNTLSGSFGITFLFNENYTDLTIDINIAEKDNTIALNSACATLLNFNPSLSVSDYNIIIHNFTNFFANKFKENTKTDPIEYLSAGFSSLKNEIYIQPGVTEGDYYYTVIEKIIPVEGSETTDYIPYRIVLKKQENNSWSMMGTPNLILTTFNTPNVPQEILNSVNYYNWRQNETTR